MNPNVQQILSQNNIPFTVRKHADCPTPIKSPHDFAACLGYDLSRISKTLFVHSSDDQVFLLVVAPMGSKINFAALAAAYNCSRIEVASPSELAKRVGYPPNGVSPLGVPGIPVAIDASLLAHPTILIGGGVTGVEVELSPGDLANVVNAKIMKLS